MASSSAGVVEPYISGSRRPRNVRLAPCNRRIFTITAFFHSALTNLVYHAAALPFFFGHRPCSPAASHADQLKRGIDPFASASQVEWVGRHDSCETCVRPCKCFTDAPFYLAIPWIPRRKWGQP